MKILILAAVVMFSPRYPLTVTVIQADHEGMSGHGFGNYTEDGAGAKITAFEYTYSGCRVVDVTRRAEAFEGRWGRSGQMVIRVPDRLIAPECTFAIQPHLNRTYVLGDDGKVILRAQ